MNKLTVQIDVPLEVLKPSLGGAQGFKEHVQKAVAEAIAVWWREHPPQVAVTVELKDDASVPSPVAASVAAKLLADVTVRLKVGNLVVNPGGTVDRAFFNLPDSIHHGPVLLYRWLRVNYPLDMDRSGDRWSYCLGRAGLVGGWSEQGPINLEEHPAAVAATDAFFKQVLPKPAHFELESTLREAVL